MPTWVPVTQPATRAAPQRKHQQLILVGRKFFFLGRAGTGKEVDGKLFIISGEVERNMSKTWMFILHGGLFMWFHYSRMVLLNKGFKGIGYQMFMHYKRRFFFMRRSF